MTDNKQYNRGSEWRKWDLHVHTPFSIIQDYGGEAQFEKFIDKLEKLPSDVRVLGISDYYFIDGYEKIIKEKLENNRLKNIKKIFPVLEFRIDTFGSGNENKLQKVNLYVLFNISEVKYKNEIKAIKDEFLSQIILKNGGNEKNLGQGKQAFVDISSENNLQNGFDNIIPSTVNVLGELSKDKWRNKTFLFLGYKEWNNVEKNNQIKPIKEDLAQKVDAFFTAGNNKYAEKQVVIKKFVSDAPLLHSQDTHDFTTLKKNNCKTWIKAETTFEGLKQIVYEPETRIFIGEEKPKKPINTIDSIILKIPDDEKVGDDKFCFAGNNNTYNLSPYFNCFIGGRGTGKSTILNFLGLHSNNPHSPKKFWDNLSPSFDPNDTNVFSFNGTEIFEFLAQSEIETFARDKSKFTQAIYNRANSHAGNILEKYEEAIGSLNGKLNQIIQAVLDLKMLEEQKTEKEKEKRTLESSVKVLSSKEYNKVIASITGKSKELQKLEDWKEYISELKNSLSELIPESENEESEGEVEKTEYEKAYNLAITKIAEAIELLKEEKFTGEIKKESEIKIALVVLENKAKAMIEKAGYTPESVEQIKSAPQKITNLESEIKSLTNQIEIKTKIIATFENVVDELNINKQNYETKITEILEPLQSLLKKQFEDNQGKDIKQISLEYSFNEDSAWEALAEEFYNYFYKKYHDTERSKEVCEFIITNQTSFATNSFKDIQKLIQQSKKSDKKYTKFLDEVFRDDKNFQIFQAIRDKHLHDVKSNKIIQVKYDDKDVEQASFGQRCTAVVVILLLFGNYPLIIDEPEAHLDSSLIANYLVPLLKEKKSDRQIIFATHNANFVINGDAEKIFILKNESGQTEVIETTIEDTKNREELLKLEGGKEAFEKRGEKLNIK